MKRLNPADPGWLTGNVINAYLWLIRERDVRRCISDSNLNPVYIFSSFFMENLLTYDANIRRHSHKAAIYLTKLNKGIDIFSFGKLVIPINRGDNTHWALAVIDFAVKEFQYYDSEGHPGSDAYLSHLKKYLLDELAAMRENKVMRRSLNWIGDMEVVSQVHACY